ncbi:MAG: NFACT RNA binding domain-containing protein [Clostridium sp.]|nr:NFACT RNA binding domain-containing protein [Clostridium sp.]
MALDGIFLHNLLQDLNPILIDSKIDKINQPEKDEIILTLRKNRKNYKLLISASSKFPRLHFTEIQKENPLKAPMFLMVLRKYLLNGKIKEVTQKDGDRIVIFTIEAKDEMGFDSEYSLIVEIMGRHSNISLVRNRDNYVVESIKHITPNINSYRVLYAGANYVFPPSSKKLNPLTVSKEEFINFIKENEIAFNKDFFFNSFTGVSKAFSKILYENSLKNDIKEEENLFDYFINTINASAYYAIYKNKEGLYKDFYSHKLSDNKEDIIEFSSPSEMLDDFFKEKDKQDRISNRTANLQKLINTNIERCIKKSKILNENIKEGEKKETYKIKGDLLTSYIYTLKKGDKKVNLLNFYSPEEEYIEISLDENKTPSENVQMYYKKYNKLKKSEEWAFEQLEKNNEELEYLNSVLTNILNVDSYEEIEDIKRELIETGYIRFKKEKGAKRQKEGKPLHFVTSKGYDIYVGKNNLQNDYLSLKFAGKFDLWLHTKNIPGSHVIIKASEVDDETLEQAAIIAAFYSKGKNGSKVPVDYTLVKNLKKPNGAKPGMVIYHTNNTIYVDPKDFNTLDIKKI